MIRGEKIKDIVEVRSFSHLYDFAADPGLTIRSYRFTDITSDLMGKWIDRISEIKAGKGMALALAGSRGVGKSHFLAVLAALTAKPELRSVPDDSHVLGRIERLPKRSVAVACVRRGSGSSLVSELRTALSEAFSVNSKNLSDSLYDLLLKASEITGDTPLLIFIDTAFGRKARVDRDDGSILSEVADAARNMGIFVGLALDDDISGADGPNSSISRSFQIDFLDQEHLYRVVDRHIFIKNDARSAELKDIYTEYREAIPGFNWSEQRFTSLYPMHPATIEISPLIRLFIQDFALLGFASEAGVKIMGRPANSLIGLDEMFANVESKLRKAPQLKSGFEHFDLLDREIVQRSPVQFRLQAKLVLIGLLLLSLDGQGASAAGIAASMLVFDRDDPSAGVAQVEKLLDRFAMEFPDAVSRIEGTTSGKAVYGLRVDLNDDLDKVLAPLRSKVTTEDLWTTLLLQLAERFPEIREGSGKTEWSSHCTVEWRGGMRRGIIVWRSGDDGPSVDYKNVDWKLRLKTAERKSDQQTEAGADWLEWETPPLTSEEKETIATYFLLRSDSELRQKFAESASTTIHLLSSAVDKICNRLFITDARIHAGEARFSLDCDLNSTHNFAQLFSEVLKPVFEEQAPAHPFFLQPLGYKEVAQLTAGFFGRADIGSSHIQNLAQWFAEPLGLTQTTDDGYTPASSESLADLPIVKNALSDLAKNGSIPLDTLYFRFGTSPMGLTREAQQLILSALVAQRQIEFLTTTGNRINHRSLDLQVIWDDVVGISQPVDEKYSTKKLQSWIKTITGEAANASIESAEGQKQISESLRRWLDQWNNGNVLEDYEDLPDERLSATSWKTASAIRRSLGTVADIIALHLDGSVSLHECIGSIADLFLDSEIEFEQKKAGLQDLRNFTDRADLLGEVNKYLTEAEITEDPNVETARHDLLDQIFDSSEDMQTLSAAWLTFRDLYKSHYSDRHADLFEGTNRQSALRQTYETPEWRSFEVYSLTSVIDRRLKARVEDLIRRYRDTSCDRKSTDLPDAAPYCNCGLKLSDLRNIARIPEELRSAIKQGVEQAKSRIKDPSSRASLTPEDDVLLLSASLAGID